MEVLFCGKSEGLGWCFGTPLLVSDKVFMMRANDFDVEIIPDTLGIYIGICDVNKKKIFTGNMGRYTRAEKGKSQVCTGKVVYDKSNATFCVESYRRGRLQRDRFPISDFEVTGYAYDGPQLLGDLV